MTNKPLAPEKDLRRYLLGEVSDDERADLEQGYFADDELFEQLVEAQNDLVDSYVQGRLTRAERKLFEERFLTTESGAERVKFARALQGRIGARSAQTPSVRFISSGVRRFAIAASVAIVVLAAGWLIFSPQQPGQPPLAESQTPAPQQSAPPAPLQAEKQAPLLERTTSQQAPAAIARDTALLTVLLTPGGTRDSDAPTPLMLRAAPQTVRVELVLEDDRFDSYAAELQDVEGRVLWREESLHAKAAASGRTVALSVPARLLPPGDYVVILQGVRGDKTSEINNYTFTVAALPARR